MSEKDALAFLSKVSEDQELQKKVGAGDPAAWDQVARAAGFDVTKEELKAASNAVTAQFRKDNNLSDDDLAKVTGGAGTSAYPTYVSVQGAKINVLNLGKIDAFKMGAW